MIKLLIRQKKLFKVIKKIIRTHPYFAVIVLHEYFRNLFPTDPYINFKIKEPTKRIFLLQKVLIDLCNNINYLGNYKISFKKRENLEFKKKNRPGL